MTAIICYRHHNIHPPCKRVHDVFGFLVSVVCLGWPVARNPRLIVTDICSGTETVSIQGSLVLLGEEQRCYSYPSLPLPNSWRYVDSMTVLFPSFQSLLTRWGPNPQSSPSSRHHLHHISHLRHLVLTGQKGRQWREKGTLFGWLKTVMSCQLQLGISHTSQG